MKFISFSLNKKHKLINFLSLIIMVYILAYFLVFSKSNFQIMSSIVRIFLEIVMPSLFPFILFSNILIYSNFFELFKKSAICKLIGKFFGINKTCASSVLFGFLFGYPNGSKFVNELYIHKKISYKEAEYLLLFINSSSPAFILSSVGIGMFKNIYVGVLLLFSHITASVIIGKIYSYKYIKEINKKAMLEENVSCALTFDVIAKSITNTLKAMGMILGFMTIFTILNNLILSFGGKEVSNLKLIKSISLCMLELTGGLNNLMNENISFKKLIMLSSAFLGFSSLSIIFQIFSTVYLNNFKIKTILKGKLLHSIISLIITYILVNIPQIYEYINKASKVNYTLFKTNEKIESYLNYSILITTIIISMYLFFCILLKKKQKRND